MSKTKTKPTPPRRRITKLELFPSEVGRVLVRAYLDVADAPWLCENFVTVERALDFARELLTVPVPKEPA